MHLEGGALTAGHERSNVCYRCQTVVHTPIGQAYRAIGNAVQVLFGDGSAAGKASVDYPIGHRRRRAERIPDLKKRFEADLALKIAPTKVARIHEILADRSGPGPISPTCLWPGGAALTSIVCLNVNE